MGFLEDKSLEGMPSIPEFYKGKTIFITGSSGFVGKVLLEKLLYSCPDLDRIYVLTRSKKGVSPEERLKRMYSSEMFDRLRLEKPGVFESKVLTIAGDVSEDGLGMSEDDRTLLINRVNIIFHAAATVRFDDHLAYAIKLNLGGTVQIIELAKQTKNLSVLVHVSTAYSNCDRNPVEEVMYPAFADWRDTLELCSKLDPHVLDTVATKFIGSCPNTYVFSKQLAEHAVYEQRGLLPAVIVRPSVVLSSHSEPVTGWLENLNGPVGFFIGFGKGILRNMYGNMDISCDYIPVDYCVRNIIATSWIRGINSLQATDDVPIYNCTSNEHCKMPFTEMFEFSIKFIENYPVKDIIWTHNVRFTNSETWFYINFMRSQLLPAILIDTILWILGKKPMLIKIQRRIFISSQVLKRFSSTYFIFPNGNFQSLCARLKKEDKDHFDYDLSQIDFVLYLEELVKAGMKYILKETEDGIENSKAHWKRVKRFVFIFRTIFYSCILYWLAKKIFF